MEPEKVILVDDNNKEIGTCLKSQVHGKTTPLHRAFSCFLFHTKTKKFLIQQRALSKKTWPGVWSNSFCGHPLPDEPLKHAVQRRMQYELGITEADLYEILPNFRYCASREGIQENEICPVWIGFTNQEPTINKAEVENTKWVDWDYFVKEINNPTSEFSNFSIWCKQETLLLNESSLFKELFFPKTII